MTEPKLDIDQEALESVLEEARNKKTRKVQKGGLVVRDDTDTDTDDNDGDE